MTPEQTATVAALTAAGLPRRIVAAHLGTSTSSVQRATKSAREIIAQIRDDLIHSTAAQAADNIKHAVKAYKDKDSDTQLREHGYKASTKMLETIGILPSHTPSVLIQQVIQGDAITITPELASSIRDGWSAQAIDVDSPVDNTSLCIDSNTRNGD